jgi:hypothetical protein
VTLVCPSCGLEHGDDERFCTRCGVPLVVAGGPAEAVLSERGERARKIKRQYSEGPLAWVATTRNQAEAELIQNLLLDQGVPSALRRTRGFDVPEMLAAGPRDVLVPSSGLETAREVLAQAEGGAPRRAGPAYARSTRVVAAALVVFILVAFFAVVILTVVTRA